MMQLCVALVLAVGGAAVAWAAHRRNGVDGIEFWVRWVPYALAVGSAIRLAVYTDEASDRQISWTVLVLCGGWFAWTFIEPLTRRRTD